MSRAHRKALTVLVGSLFALVTSACVTPTGPQLEMALAPVDQAALMTPPLLQARAAAGDATAQYAWALVLEHGLNGVAPDTQAAQVWKRRATASRGFMPITQYTAAFNGNPSRINIINVARYELTSVQAAVIESCVRALAAGTSSFATSSSKEKSSACGDAEAIGRRSGAWYNAQVANVAHRR